MAMPNNNTGTTKNLINFSNGIKWEVETRNNETGVLVTIYSAQRNPYQNFFPGFKSFQHFIDFCKPGWEAVGLTFQVGESQ